MRLILPSSFLSRLSRIVPSLITPSSSPSLSIIRPMSTSSAPVCTDGVCAMPSKSSSNTTTTTNTNTTTNNNNQSSSDKPVITIDIISDNVCPWCYVGKRRLEKAISQIPSSAASFSIRWHPYQLEPDAPEKSVPKIDRYRQKFGPNVERMLNNMIEIGKGEGIQFKYTNNGRIGNTLNSHRLVEYAYEKGGEVLQNKLINAIFHSYFELEKDISDIKTLTDIAVSVGFDQKETELFFQSDRFESEIKKSLYSNYQNNISGVPHFTFNNKYQISGGQDPSVFLNIFKKLGVKL